MNHRAALLELVVATRASLEWQRDTAIEHAPAALREHAAALPATAPGETAERSQAAADGQPVRPRGRTEPVTRRSPSAAVCDLFLPADIRDANTLAALRAGIGDCQRCKLAPHRTNLVFGVGNQAAELVFVGEAPGHDEDKTGEPFVGRAGQLLTEIVVKGMKLRREDVYIANIIKCRPPQNRNPEPDEIAACEPFLVRQLELIRPKVIVALGTFAAQVLLKTRTPITRLRGVWADYHGIPLMPTFHPAYLLRNPAEKRAVWQDVQLVMKALGLR